MNKEEMTDGLFAVALWHYDCLMRPVPNYPHILSYLHLMKKKVDMRTENTNIRMDDFALCFLYDKGHEEDYFTFVDEMMSNQSKFSEVVKEILTSKSEEWTIKKDYSEHRRCGFSKNLRWNPDGNLKDGRLAIVIEIPFVFEGRHFIYRWTKEKIGCPLPDEIEFPLPIYFLKA